MRRLRSPFPSLAAVLDRTPWDYSPTRDRSFLLAPVEEMFRGVAWEVAPEHLVPRSRRPAAGLAVAAAFASMAPAVDGLDFDD